MVLHLGRRLALVVDDVSQPSTEREPLKDAIDHYFATVSDEDFLRHLREAGFTLTPTQHCTHRHADVTAEECGLCWLRLEGDPGCMRVAELTLGGSTDVDYERGVVTVTIGRPAPVLFGWDTCREKHISEAPNDRP